MVAKLPGLNGESVKKVLITGASGYLGASLVSYCSALRIPLVLGSRSPMPHIGATAEWAYLDVKDKVDPKIFKDVGVVVHCVGCDAAQVVSDPEDAIDVNIKGALKVAGLAASCGVEKFINLSSFHVYGSDFSDLRVTSVPTPVHPYGAMHLAREKVLAPLSQKMDVLNIRIANTFGVPIEKSSKAWKLVANQMVSMAVSDSKIAVRSPGVHRILLPMSEFCRFVGDELAKAPVIGSRIVNLGCSNSMSMLVLAETISDRCSIITGSTPCILADDLKDVDSVFEYPSGFGIGVEAIELELDKLIKFCVTAVAS